MSKDEIIELLTKYKVKQGKLDLKKLDKRKKEIELRDKKEEIKINITAKYVEGSKGNKITSTIEEEIIKKDSKIIELEKEISELDKEIEKLEIEVEEVNIRLGTLTFLEKEIITAYYVDKLSYTYIGNTTYYRIKQQTRSEGAIKKMIIKILKKLENL